MKIMNFSYYSGDFGFNQINTKNLIYEGLFYCQLSSVNYYYLNQYPNGLDIFSLFNLLYHYLFSDDSSVTKNFAFSNK